MLINDLDSVLKWMPNHFAAVEGESSLLEKLEPFLLRAESELERYLIGIDSLGESVYAGCKDNAERMVALSGIYYAIPFLDLVLTPNGFGIVSSSDVAPASKDRVASLREEVGRLRDSSIIYLQQDLLQVDEWHATGFYTSFAETMFGDLSSLTALKGYPAGGLLDFYDQTFPRLRSMERFFEEKVFGRETMSKLRESALLGFLDENSKRLYLAGCLRADLVRLYNGEQMKVNVPAYIDYIRKNPDSFPEWSESEFGQWYDNAVFFENKKENGGFWFS